MQNFLIALFLLFILSEYGQSQTSLPDAARTKISINNFDYETFEETIRAIINDYRQEAGIQLLEEKQILKRAAYEQSSFMSEFNSAEQDDPGERAMLFGGTKKVEEIIGKGTLKIDGEIASYYQVARSITDRWINNPKQNQFLLASEYYYSGISATLSEDRKKIYVACMYGSHASFALNLGEKRDRYLGNKTYGLLDFDPKICKKTQKIEDLYTWANGFYTENGIIYFQHPDAKSVKKLIKNSGDGLAVDIVQKGQFPCDSLNIIDYNWLFKGQMLKRINAQDLSENNMVVEDKSDRLVVALGEMPILYDSLYEFNLIIILDKHVCANIKKSYIEIAPTRHFYSGKYYYLNDPEYPDETIPNYDKTNNEFNHKMCKRSINQWYRNDQNSFNCLLSNFYLHGIKSIIDQSNIIIETDKYLKNKIIPENMLQQLRIEASVKALELKGLTKFEEKNLLDYLKELDYSDENRINTYAIAQILINNGHFRPALNILDPYIEDPKFDNELLFSHITLSSLYQDRIQSKFYAKELQIAKKRNLKRYCELFNKMFSFQLFENILIKEDVCASCF